MKRLSQDLFERDLTPKEFERLLSEVEASPEAAQDLAQAAARAYQATGLPDPGRPTGAARLYAVAGAVALGGAMAWWLGSGEPPVLELAREDAFLAEQVQPLKPPLPPAENWKGVTPQPDLAPSMDLALRPDAQGGSQLQVLLRCRRAEAVSVDLEDSTGRVLRRLHQGPLPIGERSFTWDLRGSEGSLVPPGSYFVRVSHAQGYELRAVQVGIKR